MLILASGSPRRARILEELGVPFRVVVSAVDEAPLPAERGEDLVVRLARAKAAAVASREAGPVLAADTEVVCDGDVLGKPASPEAAFAMLRRLAGRTHEVITGLCLLVHGEPRTDVARTAVTLSPMTDDEIAAYTRTGEPYDKAGGYHVHGRGAYFIEGIAGSPSNVAGLPVRLFYELAREAGLVLPGAAS